MSRNERGAAASAGGLSRLLQRCRPVLFKVKVSPFCTRAYYNRSFQSRMSSDGLTFGTKGEFERRLSIFAENRWQYYPGEARRDDYVGTLM